MSRRKAITAAMERRIIMAQLWERRVAFVDDGNKTLTGQVVLLCACGCKQPLLPDTPVIHEHVVPLALGGADDESNIRLYRKECAALKTNGPRHVKVDGDISKIAKAKALAGETGQNKRKKPIPSRPMAKRHDPWGKEWKEKRT